MNTTSVMLTIIALAVTNLVSFGLMAYDKRCARRGKWRVPERTLFLSAACFGALGGCLGMQIMRHKTRHRKFQIFFPLMLVIQIAVLSAEVRRLFS